MRNKKYKPDVSILSPQGSAQGEYIGLNYGQLWNKWSEKFLAKGVTEAELRAIHIKWKKIASRV
jgi:hypothetical protein